MRGWKLITVLAGLLVLENTSPADEFPSLLSNQYFRDGLDADFSSSGAKQAPAEAGPQRIIQSSYSRKEPLPCAPGQAPPAGKDIDCAPRPLPSPPPAKREPCPCPECVAHRKAVAVPHAAPQAAPQAVPQAAPGMFVAPRGRGEVAGEARSLGIRGLAIHIPAMRLELPSIQLPSFIHYRREAEMRVDEAYAPFVAGAPAIYGQLAPGGAAQVAPQVPPQPPVVPQHRPVEPPPCPPHAAPQACPESREAGQRHSQDIDEKTQSIQELKRKLEKLQALEKQLHDLTSQHEALIQQLQKENCPPGEQSPPVTAPEPSETDPDSYFLPRR